MFPKGWAVRAFAEPATDSLVGMPRAPSIFFPPDEVCLFCPMVPFTLGPLHTLPWGSGISGRLHLGQQHAHSPDMLTHNCYLQTGFLKLQLFPYAVPYPCTGVGGTPRRTLNLSPKKGWGYLQLLSLSALWKANLNFTVLNWKRVTDHIPKQPPVGGPPHQWASSQ